MLIVKNPIRLVSIIPSVTSRRERPYQHDSTASRLLIEVKHVRAWLVLRWGTTLESQVLFSFILLDGDFVGGGDDDSCLIFAIGICKMNGWCVKK